MGKFRNWLFNFMQGRYGYDELGRSMSVWVIVLIIVSVVLSLLVGLFGNLLHAWGAAIVMSLLSRLVNLVALIVLVLMVFRMFSRNYEKRSAENARYLSRKAGRQRSQDLARDRRDYKYLECPFCGQKMRVPRGKGKIAVKCPSCNQKTIIKS